MYIQPQPDILASVRLGRRYYDREECMVNDCLEVIAVSN